MSLLRRNIYGNLTTKMFFLMCCVSRGSENYDNYFATKEEKYSFPCHLTLHKVDCIYTK